VRRRTTDAARRGHQPERHQRDRGPKFLDAAGSCDFNGSREHVHVRQHRQPRENGRSARDPVTNRTRARSPYPKPGGRSGATVHTHGPAQIRPAGGVLVYGYHRREDVFKNPFGGPTKAGARILRMEPGEDVAYPIYAATAPPRNPSPSRVMASDIYVPCVPVF
jgi:hypothetical protein